MGPPLTRTLRSESTTEEQGCICTCLAPLLGQRAAGPWVEGGAGGRNRRADCTLHLCVSRFARHVVKPCKLGCILKSTQPTGQSRSNSSLAAAPAIRADVRFSCTTASSSPCGSPPSGSSCRLLRRRLLGSSRLLRSLAGSSLVASLAHWRRAARALQAARRHPAEQSTRAIATLYAAAGSSARRAADVARGAGSGVLGESATGRAGAMRGGGGAGPPGQACSTVGGLDGAAGGHALLPYRVFRHGACR